MHHSLTVRAGNGKGFGILVHPEPGRPPSLFRVAHSTRSSTPSQPLRRQVSTARSIPMVPTKDAAKPCW